MKAVDFFSRDVHTFWATSFQFDLKLFDQFLLRRLGNAPLNAVVLCDENCLSTALNRVSDVDSFILASANRRYLLRGVRLPSNGRFHPKTYLFASRRQTTLAIGSGNLTRSGLDRGRETFVTYRASELQELPVIRAWGRWMRQLVAAQDDAVLQRRFEHLRANVPELDGPSRSEAFLVNDSSSMLDQLEAIAPMPVAELHVRAPYYDAKAEALGEVIARLTPTKAIHVHLGARTSVDGGALRRILESASCPTHLHGHDPDEFVHAKLLGVIGAKRRGVLFCGSANLSRAALTNVYGSSGARGNCEVLVARAGTAAEIAQAFVPPNSTLTDISLDDVEAFEFKTDDDVAQAWRMRLRSAAFLADGRLRVEAEGDLEDVAIVWQGATAPRAVTVDGVTTEAIAEDEDPQVIWLVDHEQRRCSNSIVVDDRDELEQILGDAERGRDRPAELRDEDGRSQLVALLSWAHQRFIFDVDDTAALQRAANAQEHQAESEDSDFWERYAREELSYDPRSQTYRRLGSAGSLSEVDLLLREIEAMLHSAPKDRRLRLVGADESENGNGDAGTRHPWSFSARERLRARNLLRRWARALADPRHAWLSPEAPTRNYEALLDVLTLIWLGGGLDDEHIEDLLAETWTSFIGSESRRGFLERADEDLKREALESLTDDTRQLAAGLAYAALRDDGPWQDWIYDWQPFLTRGLEEGMFRTGRLATDLARALSGEKPTAGDLEDLLRARAEWIDDHTWGKRIADELTLVTVRLVPRAGFKNVSLVVQVEGISNPAHDPRLVILARRAIALKHSDHILLDVSGQRFLLRLGEECVALVDGQMRESIAPIDAPRLAAVEQQGGTLADLLGQAAA